MTRKEAIVKYGISVFLPLIKDRAGTEMTGNEFAAEIRRARDISDFKTSRLVGALETYLDKLYVCQNGAVAFNLK